MNLTYAEVFFPNTDNYTTDRAQHPTGSSQSSAGRPLYPVDGYSNTRSGGVSSRNPCHDRLTRRQPSDEESFWDTPYRYYRTEKGKNQKARFTKATVDERPLSSQPYLVYAKPSRHLDVIREVEENRLSSVNRIDFKDDLSQFCQTSPQNLSFRSIKKIESLVKTPSDLTTMILRKDGAPIDIVMAESIRQKISQLVREAVSGGVSGLCLAFATSGLVSEGFFLVTSVTETARDWLLERDFNQQDGIPLTIQPLTKDRLTVLIPGKPELLPSDILNLLRGQNNYRTELKLSKWNLLCQQILPLGMRLILSVPSGIIEERNEHIWLNFELTQVQAKLLQTMPEIHTPDEQEHLDYESAHPSQSIVPIISDPNPETSKVTDFFVPAPIHALDAEN